MKVQLFKAINAASLVICQGYEIDWQTMETPARQRIECGEDTIATVEDQEIELDSDGSAKALTIDGAAVDFEFRVTRPMTAQDL
jgi:hypothetical protein